MRSEAPLSTRSAAAGACELCAGWRGADRRKRAFDLGVALAVAPILSVILVPAWLVARLSTGGSGIFRQQRVGRHGRLFEVRKLRTMRVLPGIDTTVTTSRDPRITVAGAVMRRFKIDEIPQIWNVIAGDMSFVGPRPDVPGFYDQLTGEDRRVLCLRPGVTGPATLMFRDEERLLAEAEDPETYNREVLFPEKVRVNLEYARERTIAGDLRYMMQTIVPSFGARRREPGE